jgi:hypothetical protein
VRVLARFRCSEATIEAFYDFAALILMNSLIFLSDLLAIFLLSSQAEFIERITYRGWRMEIELILFLQYL